MDAIPGTSHSRAYPPRFRWLKRFAVAAVVLLVGLCGLRWWRGVVAAERLEAAIEQVKAAGGPTTIEEIQPAEVDDEDNAAILLLQAAAAWRTARKDAADDRTFLIDNTAAITLVRASRHRRKCNWGVQPKSPLINRPTQHLNQLRHLAQNLEQAAYSQHRLADDQAALETIRCLLHMADCFDQTPTRWLEHAIGGISEYIDSN